MNDLQIFPEEEEISPVINECVNGLGKCLQHDKNDEVRKNILQSLFGIYQRDISDFGGIAISDDVPEIIDKYATDQECQTIGKWVSDAMKSVDRSYGDWS